MSGRSDCGRFLDLLDGFLEKRLATDEHAWALGHLARCADCRSLTTIALSDTDRLDELAPAGLADGILARTSGATCSSARDRLCEFADGELPLLRRRLVQSHLNRCADCRGLLGALRRMADDLPSLAELEPDEHFVIDVLAGTLRAPGRAARWAEQIRQGWERLLARPRLALEGAYVGTFLLALLFGVPDSPLAGVPQRALELTQTNPVTEFSRPVSELEPQVAAAVGAAWTSTGGRVVGTTRQIASGVARASATSLGNVKDDLGTFWGRLTSELASDDNTSDSEDRDLGETR